MHMMTGRDLILYILQNGLEDEPIYENGKILGFMNETEAAIKFDTGTAVVRTWLELGTLDGVLIGDVWYIPFHAKNPMEL